MPTEADLRALLGRINGFALDMDGTLYLDGAPLPGAVEFVLRARASGRRLLFLTNNSSRTAAQYHQRLRELGFAPRPGEILTSGDVAAQYLQERYPGRRVFVLGNRALREELAGQGVRLADRDPQVLLAAFDTELTYEKLCILCDGARAGLPLIATHPDLNCPVQGGMIPDLGAFLALVKAATGRDPDVILGKPCAPIVAAALRRLELPPERVAMVGDRLYTDIRTGVDHGLVSILVFSGEAQPEELPASPWQPDAAVPGVASLIPYL